MPPNELRGRQLALLFYTRDSPTSDYWTCRCGNRRKKIATSYSNLVSHITTAHKDYELIVSSDTDHTQRSIDAYFQSKKADNYFGWYDFIINALLPFSFVQKPIIRDHVKYMPMALSTFMRYLPRLTQVVEEKVAARRLPQQFAIVLDGWTSGSTQFLAVFASFVADLKEGYETRLIAFSPMEDENHLDADEHIMFMTFVLQLYNKSWENVLCLIGDNCNVNKKSCKQERYSPSGMCESQV